MLKQYYIVALGCCLSFIDKASTIEYTPDEEISPSKSWYTAKDWYPSKPVYPVKDYPVKYRPVAPAKVVAPMRVVPPVKINPPVVVPFPARIAPSEAKKYPWLITGSAGFANFDNSGDNSGGAMVGRFAIGKAFYNSGHTLAGLELGIQNGNRMSIGASQATLDEMGSLPIWTTVKPMMDILGTIQVGSDKTDAFLILKGGLAYRQWETERQSINNLSQLAGEVQAGIGLPIAKMATLNVLYQGVYGGSVDFRVNPDSSGHVANIPAQNGVLISLSLLL